MTLKTGVKMLKIQLCITEIHCILRCIQIENSYSILQFYCIFEQAIAPLSTKQVLLYFSLSPDFFEVIYHLGMSTKNQTSS